MNRLALAIIVTIGLWTSATLAQQSSGSQSNPIVLPDGMVGQPYATKGPFSICFGPSSFPGLSCNDGILSGVPTTTGTFVVPLSTEMVGTDNIARYDEVEIYYSITVQPAGTLATVSGIVPSPGAWSDPAQPGLGWVMQPLTHNGQPALLIIGYGFNYSGGADWVYSNLYNTGTPGQTVYMGQAWHCTGGQPLTTGINNIPPTCGAYNDQIFPSGPVVITVTFTSSTTATVTFGYRVANVSLYTAF